MDEVESIFTKHFASNDRKKAMKFLKPQVQKGSHMVTFFVGNNFHYINLCLHCELELIILAIKKVYIFVLLSYLYKKILLSQIEILFLIILYFLTPNFKLSWSRSSENHKVKKKNIKAFYFLSDVIVT